jgi:hypothetical protein
VAISAEIVTSPICCPPVATPESLITCNIDVFELRHTTRVGVVAPLVEPSDKRMIAVNWADRPGATVAGPLISTLVTEGAVGAVGLLMMGSSPQLATNPEMTITTNNVGTKDLFCMVPPNERTGLRAAGALSVLAGQQISVTDAAGVVEARNVA